MGPKAGDPDLEFELQIELKIVFGEIEANNTLQSWWKNKNKMSCCWQTSCCVCWRVLPPCRLSSLLSSNRSSLSASPTTTLTLFLLQHPQHTHTHTYSSLFLMETHSLASKGALEWIHQPDSYPLENGSSVLLRSVRYHSRPTQKGLWCTSQHPLAKFAAMLYKVRIV